MKLSDDPNASSPEGAADRVMPGHCHDARNDARHHDGNWYVESVLPGDEGIRTQIVNIRIVARTALAQDPPDMGPPETLSWIVRVTIVIAVRVVTPMIRCPC